MAKITDLVNGLGAGWKVVGDGLPVEETTTQPNPVASNPVPPLGADLSPTIQAGTGRYYITVQDPEGHQRALWLKPSAEQATPVPGTPTPAATITGRTAPANTRPVVGSELKSLEWDPGGPMTDVPAGATTKQPSPTSKLDSIDAKGNVVPAGDPSAKQLRDPATGTTINLVADPAGTLHDLGNDVILVKPDGSYTKVATKPKEPTQINVPGVGLVAYDPSKPEGEQYTTVIKTPATNDPKTEVRNGVTYQYDPDSKGWIKTDLPSQADIGYTLNDPNSKWIIFYDKQGKEVSRTEKPDFKAPVQVQPGSAPAADQVAAKIPSFNPQTGALEFVDNPNQLKASAATEELAKQLGLKVAAGSMSEKQAQDIITGAVNTMNAQTARINAQAAQDQTATTAAGDILTNTRGNAQTGAGMLQQRVQAATGTLQSILGNALSNKNITSIPGDTGSNLVQGLSGWTAELMGGQQTLDSAARMIQMADPSSNLADPTTQAAIGTLRQMLDKHQELTGQPHPAVVATQAAQQSQQANGFAAPPTQPVQPAPPAPVQLPQVAAGIQAPVAQVPGQNYGSNIAYTGGVPPWQQGWTAPGASYSYPGPAPWNAHPGPSFVAPPMPPPLTAAAVLGRTG